MATHYQSGSWNSSSVLQGYGLMAVIGAYEPTRPDVKRLNSRSGGEHAGHGNWMQTFNPKPVIKNGPPTKVYEYGQGSEVVIKSRVPGRPQRKVSKFKGLKKTPNVILKIGASRDVDGVQETPLVPLTDAILERNRRDSDASMGYQSSVAPKSSSTASSPVFAQRMEEFDPNVSMASSSSSDKKLGPNAAQYVSTPSYIDARNITQLIYKGKGKQGVMPMDEYKISVQKNKGKGKQKGSIYSSGMEVDTS